MKNIKVIKETVDILERVILDKTLKKETKLIFLHDVQDVLINCFRDLENYLKEK
jgi:hypothetical protein